MDLPKLLQAKLKQVKEDPLKYFSTLDEVLKIPTAVPLLKDWFEKNDPPLEVIALFAKNNHQDWILQKYPERSHITWENFIKRHHIFCFALMSILYQNHNGNKEGCLGFYYDRDGQVEEGFAKNNKKLYINFKQEYRGHNIAAIAVYKGEKIIAYSFNHCNIFHSTSEHAEERLIDSLFKNAFTFFDCESKPKYDVLLKDVTIYTTLEPCHQCSGKLYLSGVHQVIYIQPDPVVDNIVAAIFMTTMSSQKLQPLPASHYNFDFGEHLLGEYEKFAEVTIDTAFYNISMDSTPTKQNPRVPAFLCTDKAKNILQQAQNKFVSLEQEEDWDKCKSFTLTIGDNNRGETNEQVYNHAKKFVQKVNFWGRGTENK